MPLKSGSNAGEWLCGADRHANPDDLCARIPAAGDDDRRRAADKTEGYIAAGEHGRCDPKQRVPFADIREANDRIRV
jgi:hypothetical protein